MLLRREADGLIFLGHTQSRSAGSLHPAFQTVSSAA
jgi:hypothetical protein